MKNGNDEPGKLPQDMAEPVPVKMPIRGVVPLAPGAEAEAVKKPVGKPAEPRLWYEVNPRTQRTIVTMGLIAYVFILLVLFWPRA